MKGQVVGPLQFGGMNLTIDGGCTIKYVHVWQYCMAKCSTIDDTRCEFYIHLTKCTQ